MALGVDGAAAEDGSEVEHVVLDPGAPVGRLEHVEAVDAARVVVIQPGAEDPRSAQLAPVLVRDEIVRVVRAPAVVAEVAERRAGREAADEHTVASVLEAGGAVEDVVEIVFLQRRRRPLSGSRIVAPSAITSASRSISAR